MYVIPPMDDDPPPAYVDFVRAHRAELHRETERLVGGDAIAEQIYLDALADVAGHWRRLHWLSRLTKHDVVPDYVRRRLHSRTKHWRDEQLYPVDVLAPPRPSWVPMSVQRSSLALRKSAVLPATMRTGVIAVAEAGIAWVHAYRRQQWHRAGRLVAAGILLIGGIIQYMSLLSATH